MSSQNNRSISIHENQNQVLQNKWSKDYLNGFAKHFGLALKAAKFCITDYINCFFFFSVFL